MLSVLLTVALTTGFSLLIISTDRQAIVEQLYQRQAICLEVDVKPIDVPRMYHRKVHAMEIAEHEDLREPYLVKAFTDVAWPARLTGRLPIAVRPYKRCVDQVEIKHGDFDPSDRQPDMVASSNRLVLPAAITQLNDDGCSGCYS